jgi:hypothetical protein
MAWGKINLTAGGGTQLDFNVTSYETAESIPATGNASTVDFAAVSSIAAPSNNSGGIMIAPALSLPSTRLDGTSLQDGDYVLAYASVGNTTVDIGSIFQIRIISVFQRQSGTWAKVVAKVSDRGAAFVPVDLWLYYLGEEFTNLTGGWRSIGSGYAKNADNLYFNGSGSSGSSTVSGGWYINQIDVSDLSTIHIVGKRDSNKAGSGRFNLTTNISSALLAQNNAVTYLTLSSNTTQTEQTLDVSSISGLLYPCLTAYTASSTCGYYMYNLWSE